MQYLGSEVRQLRRLFKTDCFYPECVGTDSWVGRHIAVHVRPYLNGTCVHSTAHQRGSEVAAATTESCRNTVCRGPDKSADHRGFSSLDVRQYYRRKSLLNRTLLGHRFAIGCVRHDAASRIHMNALQPSLVKCFGDHPA